MALINCPECGTKVSDKAEKCPKCAFPINDRFVDPVETKEKGLFLQTLNFGCSTVFITIAIIIAIIILIILFPPK